MTGLHVQEGPRAGEGARGREEPETRQWLTLPGRKQVLAVAHTVAYAKRLLEVLALLEGDFRVQALFTVPPHVFGREVPRFLARLGAPVLPWEECCRRTFDLALAAGPRGVEALRSPLVTLPHGANYLKVIPGTDDPGVAGLRRRDVMPGGRMPAAVVLPHRDDLAQLASRTPEVLPTARVVGDPVYDRITASLPRRAAYRRALGLTGERKLVVAVSTWGPRSAFGSFEMLLPRLVGELPPEEYRVAVLLHPNTFSAHGSWQVRAWLGEYVRRGVAVVPPDADWRSLVIAADWIIGDHGSVTLYGTLGPAPVLLAASPQEEINPASPAAELALRAPTLVPGHPLADQLRYASAEYREEDRAAIAARITSEPGHFGRLMRDLVYELLHLSRPARPALPRLLPLPPPLDSWSAGGEGPAEGLSA